MFPILGHYIIGERIIETLCLCSMMYVELYTVSIQMEFDVYIYYIYIFFGKHIDLYYEYIHLTWYKNTHRQLSTICMALFHRVYPTSSIINNQPTLRQLQVGLRRVPQKNSLVQLQLSKCPSRGDPQPSSLLNLWFQKFQSLPSTELTYPIETGTFESMIFPFTEAPGGCMTLT